MDSFDELYEKYHKDIYNFLYKLSGYDHHLADELTQETYYHAYLSITKFKGECHIRTWIMQIAKNRFFMYLRKNKIKTLSLDVVLSETLCSSSSPQKEVEEMHILSDALNIVFGMNDQMKEVFLRRIYSNSTYAQISKDLGITESSAKVLFYRGKRLLQKLLKEDCGYEI